MNRLQFLTEMKKSLLNTTKEITFPILSEEMEKVEDAADQMIGLQWYKIKINASSEDVQEHYVNGKSILIYKTNDGELKAIQKICEKCQSLVQWLSHEQKLKCFSCENTYDCLKDDGDLTCKHYFMRNRDGSWFIGM